MLDLPKGCNSWCPKKYVASEDKNGNKFKLEIKMDQTPDVLSEAIKLGILNNSASSMFHLYQSAAKNN